MKQSTLTNRDIAILGLLAEHEWHGYELEQTIGRRGLREWTEIGFSSVYAILNKLEKAGLLASQPQPQQDRPARRVYRVTPQGMAALRSAIRRRLAAPGPHSADLDLALAYLPVLNPQEVREATLELRAHLERIRERVLARQTAAADQGALPGHVAALFQHTLHQIESELRWLSEFESTFPHTD